MGQPEDTRPASLKMKAPERRCTWRPLEISYDPLKHSQRAIKANWAAPTVTEICVRIQGDLASGREVKIGPRNSISGRYCPVNLQSEAHLLP